MILHLVLTTTHVLILHKINETNQSPMIPIC